MQFIPIIERVAEAAPDGTVPWSSWRDRPLYVQEGDVVTRRSVTPGGYGRFLIDVFEEWVWRDVAHVFVQMFDTALANWVGERPGLCVHCETCGLALALEHTGDVYSCDHFVEPRYLLGNITERHLIDLVTSDRQRQFGLDKRDTLPRYCRECDVRFACHGGCPRTDSPQPPTASRASTISAPASGSSSVTCGPRCGRCPSCSRPTGPPPRSWTAYASGDSRRGRNDPCTCGSARKWKNCHGDSSPPVVHTVE